MSSGPKSGRSGMTRQRVIGKMGTGRENRKTNLARARKPLHEGQMPEYVGIMPLCIRLVVELLKSWKQDRNGVLYTQHYSKHIPHTGKHSCFSTFAAAIR